MIPADEPFREPGHFQPGSATGQASECTTSIRAQGDPWSYSTASQPGGTCGVSSFHPSHENIGSSSPDHMGFGKSETPSDRNYLLEEHVDNLENPLVDELDLRDITLVLHDWGGLIGGGIALRHPDRVAGIFMMNTLVPLDLDHEIAHLSRTSSDRPGSPGCERRLQTAASKMYWGTPPTR